jgi:hypothetical protein
MKIEVSDGEILDKLSILEIKLEKIDDVEKIKNIQIEYEILSNSYKYLISNFGDNLVELYSKLKETNQKLWDIENDIRECEANNTFTDYFIGLARHIYITNDRRSMIKKQINIKTKSKLIEEKSYYNYI